MISLRDVIWLKVPYPNISSGLALKSHMYICMNSAYGEKEFAKVSSLKPGHLIHPIHHIVEAPNISRNPFCRVSIIDCDKFLKATGIIFPLTLRTIIRPNISCVLYDLIIEESSFSGIITLDDQWLLSLNSDLCRVPN